jgi:hypothetical protein
VKYFIKNTQFSRTTIASNWQGREDGNLYQIAVVETITGPALFTIFDNRNGRYQVTPFPTRLVFTGDKPEGVALLRQRYDIEYKTPKKEKAL